MKPVCVPCQRFLRLKKAGYYFIETMPKPGERHPEPGTTASEKWTPYKVWSGDLWECLDCGAQIVQGVGFAPITEHYREDFAECIKRLRADQLQVNDC